MAVQRNYPIVYFDTNEGDNVSGVYPLWLPASVEDLLAIEGGPRNGEKVILFMGDIEAEAILAYNDEHAAWTGTIVPGTVKDVAGTIESEELLELYAARALTRQRLFQSV